MFFKCEIEANPAVYKLEWLQDGRKVEQDLERGILVSGSSLVLQRVRREQAGNYSCRASNLQGDAVSNQKQISIKCELITGQV